MATGSRDVHSVDGDENKWGFGKNVVKGSLTEARRTRRDEEGFNAFKIFVFLVAL
jgi:hypothetical protein